eukprot:9086773-Lingulodinium_polyedra.AAC.1
MQPPTGEQQGGSRPTLEQAQLLQLAGSPAAEILEVGVERPVRGEQPVLQGSVRAPTAGQHCPQQRDAATGDPL